MSEQAGIDTRQRGFFWGPNELIKHWVPLIGLDGVGLLNSYDVWCDRRQESNTKGFAFPTRLQEATFYGVSKSTLAVLTAILEAVGWLHVKAEKRTTGHGRGGGGTTYTVKNFYEIINRDWTLTLEDVFAVLRLADEDNRVFKRIKHIFRPDFAPIDSKDNPWLAFLPQLRQDPLWQRLAEKAQKRSASYRARRHGTDQDNPNRRSLPVATGWNPPCNRRSLVVTTGKPTVPTVTNSDRKHDGVDGDEGGIDPIQHFASLVGHSDYNISERDLAELTALHADGYSNAEITAGIKRAVTAALARKVTPNRFTYCVSAVRDVPPVHPISVVLPLTSPGQPAPATEQTAMPAVAIPPVAPSGLLAAMPDSMHEACQQLRQSAQRRGMDLSEDTIRDLARLALDFDTAAQRQGSSGLDWTLAALRKVDSQVETPARYVRAILERWKAKGCDALQIEHPAQATSSQLEKAEPTLPQAIAHLEPPVTDPQARLWEQALAELRLQMTQATFDTWLRNTRLLELRQGDDGAVWVVQVTSRYAQDWLENRLLRTIQRTLVRLTPGTVHVEFVVPQ